MNDYSVLVTKNYKGHWIVWFKIDNDTKFNREYILGEREAAQPINDWLDKKKQPE